MIITSEIACILITMKHFPEFYEIGSDHASRSHVLIQTEYQYGGFENLSGVSDTSVTSCRVRE